MLAAGAETEDAIKFLAEDSGNVNAEGFFSADVLRLALVGVCVYVCVFFKLTYTDLSLYVCVFFPSHALTHTHTHTHRNASVTSPSSIPPRKRQTRRGKRTAT